MIQSNSLPVDQPSGDAHQCFLLKSIELGDYDGTDQLACGDQRHLPIAFALSLSPAPLQ
ncbi:hypothetical protein Pse7367_3808 (plasmid) [Thalassoporum mexicanum PCC 7367]|uniref:hypothetical protein n=1 Tax=Thalassoporum mexicanum TaxID=3457544 RepID=UPI00029FC391|nr:hypothetical protein [Pseudanabaena sp. PCC 7367]AFY72031.1 hypothetical protein Pse7367_3808 [Pseudanabaena sp. PCC 7367]